MHMITKRPNLSLCTDVCVSIETRSGHKGHTCLAKSFGSEPLHELSGTERIGSRAK